MVPETLKAFDNLPIPVEGVTWMSMQVFDLIIDHIGVIVTHGSVLTDFLEVFSINVLQELELRCLLRDATIQKVQSLIHVF